MSIQKYRAKIRHNKHVDEHELVASILEQIELGRVERESILKKSQDLVAVCRDDSGGKSLLDSFLLEFGLSNKEGVALMCLAEALLRVPDALTADRLIAEKIDSGDWQEHSGKSDLYLDNIYLAGKQFKTKLFEIMSMSEIIIVII